MTFKVFHLLQDLSNVIFTVQCYAIAELLVSYRCAADDKMSTVPQLSFLLTILHSYPIQIQIVQKLSAVILHCFPLQLAILACVCTLRGTISFYPRDTMLARVLAVIVCLSVCLCVCLSVKRRYCIKTAKRRITQTMPLDSPGTLVF